MVKFVQKSINLSRLTEELDAAGLGEHGILFAGFTTTDRNEMYTVNGERRIIGRATSPSGHERLDYAEPGELRFKYTPALDVTREAALDTVLAAHDATQSSRSQINRQADRDALPVLVSSYQTWDSLTRAQKDRALRHVLRLVISFSDNAADVE